MKPATPSTDVGLTAKLPIVSWTTTERFIRTTLVTLMFTAFCLWCFWDRFVTYPRENVESVAQNYPEVLKNLPVPDAKITSDLAKSLKQGTAFAEIVKAWGPPAFKDDARAVYFGELGAMEIPLSRSSDLIRADARWIPASKHSSVDLTVQLIMGIVLVPLSAWLLWLWFGVVTTRVELNNRGLKLRGRTCIPFESMVSMDSSRYAKKGAVEVTYQDGTRQRKFRLNDYHQKAFSEIVSELCARTGFEDPVQSKTAAS